MAQLVDHKSRILNHVEMLYQPGERQLAITAYQALGCKVTRTESATMVVHVSPDGDDTSNNVLYASEVAPEQWELEQALKRVTKKDPELARTYATYMERYRSRPHGITHFGIRYSSAEQLEAALAIMEKDLDQALKDRFRVTRVYHPQNPDARSKITIQAFITTDIIAAGFFTFGQLIELQAKAFGSAE